MILGVHEEFDISGELDKDGDLEVWIRTSGDWLTKDDAVKLIEHLTKVFKLKDEMEGEEEWDKEMDDLCATEAYLNGGDDEGRRGRNDR